MSGTHGQAMTTLLTASARLHRLGCTMRQNIRGYVSNLQPRNVYITSPILSGARGIKTVARRARNQRSEKIQARDQRSEKIQARNQRSEKIQVAQATVEQEMGGKKEVFAASLIAGPCFVVYSLWTWAQWYEQEQHEQNTGKEQEEGWFKLLGISSLTPPPLISLESMYLNFTECTALLLTGQQSPYVLVTNAFSHMDAGHLAGNMLGLYLCSINVVLPSRLGAFKFVSLFLASAVAGSLAQMCLSIGCYVRTHDQSYVMCNGLGASGGISGLVVAAVQWRPNATLIMPGFLFHGIPIWCYLVFCLGSDLFGLGKQLGSAARGTGSGSQTGHGAHLGGAAIGYAAFVFWRKTLLKF